MERLGEHGSDQREDGEDRDAFDVKVPLRVLPKTRSDLSKGRSDLKVKFTHVNLA